MAAVAQKLLVVHRWRIVIEARAGVIEGYHPRPHVDAARRHRFFTGLPGAGKSTLARALHERLSALGRCVTLLDGDAVRTLLSSELGYSRAHRDLNVLRIG